MARLGLLAAIRARAAARGTTLSALAHAAGMQPSNLRRMFSSASRCPRLGSVMRLLAPLHCRVAPPGTRTAAELAAYLEDQRRRIGVEWGELLGTAAQPADRIASSFTVDPERLLLDVVMRAADALRITLALVDDDADTLVMNPSIEKRPLPRPRRSTRRPKPSREERLDSAECAPSVAPAAAPSSMAPASPAKSVAPTPAFVVEPLRPPRLGRYRDAPREPATRPTPPPWTPTAQTFTLSEAVAPHLAELTGEDWSNVFSTVWTGLTGAASLPARFVDGLGAMTADTLHRLRRPRPDPPPAPSVPDLPDGWHDGIDVQPLVHFWQKSRAPGYRSTDTWFQPDAQGVRVGHVSLDGTTAAAVRLAARGLPPRLSDLILIRRGHAPEFWLSTEVPLEIKLNGERRAFRHVHARPVFGELVVGDRVLLVAALSVLIVVVEVVHDTAKIVWGGRAERLPLVALEMKQMDPEPPPQPEEQPMELKSSPQPATSSAPVEHDSAADMPQSDPEARLAIMSRELEDERRRRVAAERERDALMQIIAIAEQTLPQLQAELRAQADARHVAEQETLREQQRRVAAEAEYADARRALDEVEQFALSLQTKLGAEATARQMAELRTRSALRVMLKLSLVLVQTPPGADPETTRRQLLALVDHEEKDGGSLVQDTARLVVDKFVEFLRLRHAASKEPSAAIQGQTKPIAAARALDGVPEFGSTPTNISTASVVIAPGAPPENQRSSAARTMKPGRNEPCPCGSAAKYKRCCGRGA